MPRQGRCGFKPNSGGKPVPELVRSARKHACAAMPRSDTLDVVGAWIFGFERSPATSMRATPVHLCRLRYFGDEHGGGFGFFAYSRDNYELSVFASGQFFGPREDAFEVSAKVYLR